MTFGIQFKFDVEGEPPLIYIADHEGHGTCYVEIFEEPILKNEYLSWSRNDKDWEAGPVAKTLLEFMNSLAYEELFKVIKTLLRKSYFEK